MQRKRGRPKSFDREEAVLAAMLLFWERGYEGTTFDDLTGVMGINPSSFRNTFKSKEALYREATNAYVIETGSWFFGILSEEADARAAFARLLEETAELYTQENRPLGCMISLAATNVATSLDSIKEMMAKYRAAAETAMAERIEQGKRDDQIAHDVDSTTVAAFFHAVFRGMAVQARDGATKSRLLGIGKMAMLAFPNCKRHFPDSSETTPSRDLTSV